MHQNKLSAMRIIKYALILFLWVPMLLLSGCADVRPWERGFLAKPQMAIDPYPMQSNLRAHNYSSREAAASGNSIGGGGGCGCY